MVILIDVKYACYWVEVVDKVVTNAPPIARWMIGKSWSAQVVPWLEKKGATYQVVVGDG